MARTKQKIEDVVIELTPMIDVVFLLLIFFIVTLKFKVLEGKLPTFLPKDVGVNAAPVDDLLEKLEVYIVAGGTTEGRNGERFAMQIALQGAKVSSLLTFHDRLAAMKERDPELKLTLYPQEGINYEQVVKVVDECVRAQITDITFAGVAFDK
jgi:biopolymer transport protein ExbD